MALGLSGSFGAAAAQQALRQLQADRIAEEQRAIENAQTQAENEFRNRQIIQAELSGDVNRKSTQSGDALALTRFNELDKPKEARDATLFNMKLPVIQGLSQIQQQQMFSGLPFNDLASDEQITERATTQGRASGMGALASFNAGGREVAQAGQDIDTGGRLKEIAASGAQAANVARINAGRGIGGGISFGGGGGQGGGQTGPLSPEDQKKLKQLQNARNVLIQGARSDRRAAEASNAIEARIKEGDFDGAHDLARDLGVSQFVGAERGQYDTFAAAEEASAYAYGLLKTYPMQAGPWKAIAETAKPWLLIKQDKTYGEARQVVELGQAELRRGLFGTALTEAEKASASRFLIDDNDPYETMLWKLKGNQEFLRFRQDLMAFRKAGLPRPKIDDYFTIGKSQQETPRAPAAMPLQPFGSRQSAAPPREISYDVTGRKIGG